VAVVAVSVPDFSPLRIVTRPAVLAVTGLKMAQPAKSLRLPQADRRFCVRDRKLSCSERFPRLGDTRVHFCLKNRAYLHADWRCRLTSSTPGANAILFTAGVRMKSSRRQRTPAESEAHMSQTNPRRYELAYLDRHFLESEDARPLRILAEYLKPLQVFRRERIRDTIVFFGSARLTEDGPLGHYYAQARELARLVTEWSKSLPAKSRRFIVCSGGGPGIMEAANRGASDARGLTIGLNIGLPHEQRPNPYITRELCLEFRYFFMRKLWFTYPARAFVAFPGGYGTLDELMEVLTLSQTRKLARRIPVVLFGSSYWKEIVNFEGLLRHGMISSEDLELFHYADDPQSALALLQRELSPMLAVPATTPALATSIVPDEPPPPQDK